MLRSLLIREGAPCAWVEGEAAVRRPQAGERLWVNVVSPTSAELELLRERFELHPVAIDSCLRIDTRPKIEEYREQLFIVLHQLVVPTGASAPLTSLELHAFLGDGYLITIQDAQLPEVAAVGERLLAEPSLRERSLVYAYYLICERLAHTNFDALDVLFETVEKIEDSVLQEADDDVLPELFVAKRRLAGARRLIVPQREVLAIILDSGTTYIDDRSRLYFRRVLDMLMRMSEAIDTQREILSNVLDAHLSLVSNRTNEIMKSLTLLSAIFMPLGFVTGFFGQNFEHLPFGSAALMWVGLATCVLLPLGMLFWFKSRKWL
jgi:magnesium transporter